VPPSENAATDLVPDPAPPEASPPPPDAPPVVRPVAKPVADRDYEHVYDDDGEFDFDDDRRPRRLALYVRILLAVMAVGFTALIVVALCLNPYQKDDAGGDVLNDDGSKVAKTQATHTQLGLPPCSSMQMFGKPCPACGMTTSFALLTHGDVVNSMRANWVGTLMCAALIALTPWLLVSAVRGRLLWVRNGELFSTIILSGLLLLMVGRWAWIMFVP
jgi:Protein of unknown function (DUF2752)